MNKQLRKEIMASPNYEMNLINPERQKTEKKEALVSSETSFLRQE